MTAGAGLRLLGDVAAIVPIVAPGEGCITVALQCSRGRLAGGSAGGEVDGAIRSR